MSNFLYHGSVVSDICVINASSVLHGTSDTKVVYLTDSLPYSLFYIWDSKHNIKSGKHVTAWIKNGTVFYEEQFKNQLEAFYKGVSGFVYCVERTEAFKTVSDRESMWYSENDSAVEKVIYISDVYSEIMRYAEEGLVKIIYFDEVPEERIAALYQRISKNITKKGLLGCPESSDARFYKAFFEKAWNDAEKMNTAGKIERTTP